MSFLPMKFITAIITTAMKAAAQSELFYLPTGAFTGRGKLFSLKVLW